VLARQAAILLSLKNRNAEPGRSDRPDDVDLLGNSWGKTRHAGGQPSVGIRTTVRELDEMIARTRSATERETKLVVRALPACSLRRRKKRVVRTMRDQLQRLENLRSAVYRSRQLAVRLR
jgi:hypothetical protein